MRIFAIVLVLIAFAAGPVFGQAGYIGIYGDNQGMTPCGLRDQTPGLTPYYIVHTNTPGATASRFWAPKPWCSMAQYLADTAVFPVTVGNSQTGVAIGYGSCRQGPIHVLTINFFTQGLTPSCCCYFIYGDPRTSGQVEVVDCAEHLLYATGSRGVINSTIACDCPACTSPGCLAAFYAGSDGCINYPVPVQESTWGRVKQLYSE
jgi:hypothetical protein